MSHSSRRSSSPLQVILGIGALALLHSLLASRGSKRTVERVLGSRVRNGWYRAGFNLQAVACVIWGLFWFIRLPDRELYTIRPPFSWVLRAIQGASLSVVLRAVGIVGWRRFLGWEQAKAYLRGEDPKPEPEAQGPVLEDDGELSLRGPFRYTRHPDNLPALGVLWCFPRMTVNRVTLAALLTCYALLGSLHEDARLRAAYGEAHRRYSARVPFFFPNLRLRAHRRRS